VILLIVNHSWPDALSDKNSFLKDFLDSDLLSTVGLMTSISLAGAVPIHFALNDYETKAGKKLPDTKRAIRLSSVTLILLFLGALVVVIGKPLVAESSSALTYFNMVSIIILAANASIMYDLLSTALSSPSAPDRTP
jgi:hypothetical protein